MPERIPPHSREAEQSTLGSVLVSKDALADVIEILDRRYAGRETGS